MIVIALVWTTPHQDNSLLYRYWSWWVVLLVCSGGSQWRNEPKNLGGGGTIFARERSDRAGGGCGRGVSPLPCTLGSFFIFRLEYVQSGAFLRRKFRLDDMYYMGKRVTIRPIGKRVFFHELGNIIMQICTPKFQTHAMYYITYNILIWRRYPDVETRERNERAWRGCDAVGCHSSAASFYYLWYGAIYQRQYTDKH